MAIKKKFSKRIERRAFVLVIEPVDGWVLLSRDEIDGKRTGKWYIAWPEVFSTKRHALAFACDGLWQPPFKAVRGSLSAVTE